MILPSCSYFSKLAPQKNRDESSYESRWLQRRLSNIEKQMFGTSSIPSVVPADEIGPGFDRESVQETLTLHNEKLMQKKQRLEKELSDLKGSSTELLQLESLQMSILARRNVR